PLTGCRVNAPTTNESRLRPLALSRTTRLGRDTRQDTRMGCLHLSDRRDDGPALCWEAFAVLPCVQPKPLGTRGLTPMHRTAMEGVKGWRGSSRLEALHLLA